MGEINRIKHYDDEIIVGKNCITKEKVPFFVKEIFKLSYAPYYEDNKYFAIIHSSRNLNEEVTVCISEDNFDYLLNKFRLLDKFRG